MASSMRPAGLLQALCLLLLTCGDIVSAASLGSLLPSRRALVRRDTSPNFPAPISFPASQYWEGNDGNWSSFPLRIGTPPQVVRVFPSTAGYNNFVIDPRGCPTQFGGGCNDARGGIYNYNLSTSWKTEGVHILGLDDNLGYRTAGTFGTDNVTLGWEGSGGPTIDTGVVAAVVNTTFWLGIFGLKPVPTNLTDMNNPRPAYISQLKSRNLTSSTAYAYTAGNRYRLGDVYGSLIVGGYDTSRFTATNVTFPLTEDVTRDLVVNVQSIGLTARGQSLGTYNNSFAAVIDSTMPFLYLPTEACAVFEQAFGLTYNTTTQYYVVNSSLHTRLVQNNPTVTLNLGPQASGGPSVAIALPYAAFDLNATFPTAIQPNLTGPPVGYFPLRRASDPAQYALGRTFMQEAYLIADYDRRNFTVAPCKWDANTQRQQLKTLLSPALAAEDAAARDTGSGLSGGAIAGIVIGALAGLAIIAGIIVFFLLRRRRAARQREQEKLAEEQRLNAQRPEKQGDGTFYGPGEGGADGEAGAHDYRGMANGELSGTDTARYEMMGTKGAGATAEMESPYHATAAAVNGTTSPDRKSEMEARDADYFQRRQNELEGSSPPVYELDSRVRDVGRDPEPAILEDAIHPPAAAPAATTAAAAAAHHHDQGAGRDMPPTSAVTSAGAASDSTPIFTPDSGSHPMPSRHGAGQGSGSGAAIGNFVEEGETSPRPPVSPIRPDHDPKSSS